MSKENRKREFERLVSLGRSPPQNLVDEFGGANDKKTVAKAPEKVAKVVKKSAKKGGA